MSAILMLAESSRRIAPHGWEELRTLADAAEAELKELDQIAAVQRKGVQAMSAQIAERDQRDAELREALELYKGHELKLERLVREVFRWATGEGPKAPIAPDREAQVQREAEEFYGRQG